MLKARAEKEQSELEKFYTKVISECLRTCPGPDKCQKGGYIIATTPDGREVSLRCELYHAHKKQKELELLTGFSIPPKYFKDFNPITADLQTAYKLAFKYAEAQAYMNGSWLVLLGSYGVGKTHLAASIANHAVSKLSTAVFAPATRLADGTLEDIAVRFSALMRADLVVIDDLSIELDHKAVEKAMFSLISDRYEREKGLIITSNLSPDNFRAVIGERIFDRIAERAVIFEIKDARSYRIEKRKSYTSWANGVKKWS